MSGRWVRGAECLRCGIAWSVIKVRYRVRSVDAAERETLVCADLCFQTMRSLSACQGRKHAAYEYVTEVEV